MFLQMVCKDSSVNRSECAKVALEHWIYDLSMICSNVPVQITVLGKPLLTMFTTNPEALMHNLNVFQ